MLKIIQKLKKYIIFLLTVSWYVSISMKNYLIWKKTLKLTQIKIRAAKIKVVGPIDVEYSIFKKVLGTSAEVFSFQFMPIRTIFGCQFIFFSYPK